VLTKIVTAAINVTIAMRIDNEGEGGILASRWRS
jgi:hypothetical protein